MIYLTRLNGDKFMLNVDLIEIMEETPDTVITLTNGKKIVVRDSIRNIKKDILKFKRKVFRDLKT